MNVKRIVVVLIVIVFGAYGLYSLPIKVDYEINTIRTVLGDNKENHDMKVKLTFRGYRSRKLLLPDKFKGSMFIEDREFKMVEFNIGTEEYLLGLPEGEGDVVSIGFIYTDSKFDKVAIGFHDEGSWSTKDGIIFAGPAEKREDAIELTKYLFESTNSLYKESEIR